MKELTRDLVREVFEYRDGELYWKVPTSVSVNIGDLAGTIAGGGYRQIKINYTRNYAHRLIFLYHHGYLPKFLDHIDGNPSNNDISNLREATQQENCRNAKKHKFSDGKTTTSKYKGVYWDKRDKKWRAQIQIGNERRHLGLFTSEIEAARAYDKVAITTFGEFARLNFDTIEELFL